MSEETLMERDNAGNMWRRHRVEGVGLLGREGNCAGRTQATLFVNPERIVEREGGGRGKEVLERKDFARNRDKGRTTGKEGRKEEAAIFLQTTAA